MLENINNIVLLMARNSYPGTIQTDTLKVTLARINIIVLCVAKYLYSEEEKTHKETHRGGLLDIIKISVLSVARDLSPGTT